MNLSIFFSFLNTIASRAYDAIANRSRPFAALTPAQRATAIANLTARAESNLDQAEQGWRNPCWLTNADTYLTLATEYGYIEGATRRRLDRLRGDFDSLESVNDYTEGDDYNAATIHYAGLSCGCGDYSCPRMHNDTAQCVNAE